MNVLIGINHPKQVHMFKNLFRYLSSEGHSCHILVVDKEISCVLLDELNIPYFKIGKNRKNKIIKLISLIPLSIKTIYYAKHLKTDIFLGQALVHLGVASFLLKKSFIILEDTENAIITQTLANPFANTIITPFSFNKEFGQKQIRVNASFELAYLRKNWFKPNKNILSELNLAEGEIFTVVRFVGWSANHDIGHSGITYENKIKLVEEFSRYGRVIITSEAALPKQLIKYKIKIKVSEMHSLLYYARLVYGESASMAAEAAYLGTPAIYLDNVGRGYTDEQVKHNLIYTFTESLDDQLASIEKGKNILNSINKNYWKINAENMIRKRIDIGAFLIWFIENYPKSKKIMKENLEYQNRFK